MDIPDDLLASTPCFFVQNLPQSSLHEAACVPSSLVNVYRKRTGKSPFFMRKSTISMAMFNSKLFVYQRVILKRKAFGSTFK